MALVCGKAEVKKAVYSLIGALFLILIPAITKPVHADADRWSVDMADSRLGFIATQASAEFKGQFHKFSADISFSPDDLAHSLVDIKIDMLSVDTQSRDRDSTLPSSDWFHTSVFPTARFFADRFVDKGEGRFEAHAKLTMRDISHSVVLPFELTIEHDPKGARAKVRGQLDILRTAWGVGQGQWADTSTVGDKVVVTVELTATRPN